MFVSECITVVTLCIHFENLLRESTDTFFFSPNVKFDVNVRSRSVNLHVHDNYAILYICNCIHHSTCLLCQRQKQSPVQIQSTLSCF